MSIENEKTLEVYDKKANTYIEALPKGAKVFEIGSADGTNSNLKIRLIIKKDIILKMNN